MPHLSRTRPTRRALLAVAAGVLLIGTLPLAAAAAPPQAGFKTLALPMIEPGPGAPLGTEIKALITVGDTIGGYEFESIPDGISYWQSAKNTATVLVNHETSTVPFPYKPSGAAPTTANSLNDFVNSELSELVIRKGGQILSADKVIDSDQGFQRFCSNFLATSDGFEDRSLLFTNEEGIDWVYEDVDADGLSWTNDPLVNLEGHPDARQIGVVVAYDPDDGSSQPIWGMGRHNHENSVAIPGYGYPVLLSGDDSFNQNRPQSQLYAYIASETGADDADAVWDDQGDLWAFAPDSEFETINSYYDFLPNSDLDISGHFVKVDKDIAMGKVDADPTERDLMSTDFPGHPLPPSDGSWQRPPGATSGAGIDGPQWVLEHWGDPVDEDAGDYGNNVFQFLRIEDIAYDRTNPNIVYLVDSGRGLSPTASIGFAPWRSTNGRIWKMVLDETDPTIVDSLTILIDGEDHAVKDPGEIHQPDNIESTVNGLLITEDPGSAQQFPVDSTDPAATTARLMYYSFATGDVTAVLKVDQSADEAPGDLDPAPATGSPFGQLGSWETSGIVDVSSVFGPGKFMITVQAHTLFVDYDTTSADDFLAPTGSDYAFKREGGQLLLVTLPGL